MKAPQLLVKLLQVHLTKVTYPKLNNTRAARLNAAVETCTQLESTPFYATTDAQVNPTVKEVRVDMAGMRVESRPIELVTSVGSCVALCLYDPANKCGGMAHIMLPDSSISPQELLPSKFADTAVPALTHAIYGISGRVSPLSAKIIGGANMFPTLKNNSINIGAKNVEAIKTALATHKIKLLAEDVGGAQGRRVNFNVVTGVATVRRIKGELKKL